MPDGYLTVEQAADYLGCSTKTIRRMLADGLKHARFSGKGTLRFKREWLDEFMAAQKQEQPHYEEPVKSRSFTKAREKLLATLSPAARRILLAKQKSPGE